MASLVYRTTQKQKIKEKLKNKPISLEEMVQAKVHKGSPGGRSKTMRVVVVVVAVVSFTENSLFLTHSKFCRSLKISFTPT